MKMLKTAVAAASLCCAGAPASATLLITMSGTFNTYEGANNYLPEPTTFKTTFNLTGGQAGLTGGAAVYWGNVLALEINGANALIPNAYTYAGVQMGGNLLGMAVSTAYAPNPGLDLMIGAVFSWSPPDPTHASPVPQPASWYSGRLLRGYFIIDDGNSGGDQMKELTDFTITIDGKNPPLPEPATWAYSIIGFCAIGATMRRKIRLNDAAAV